MKALIALVLLLVAGWLGATWYVGSQAENLVRTEVAKAELLPGRDDLKLVVSQYERGLFSAEARTCLVVQGELAALGQGMDLSNKLCFVSTIHHGPVGLSEKGLFVGLAATEDALDVSALPPEVAPLIQQVFQGRAPLEGSSFYGFDGSVSATALIPPVALDSPQGKVVLEQFQLDIYRPDVNGYPVNGYLTLKGLEVDSPSGGFAVPSLTGTVDVMAMLGDDLPLTNTNLQGKGLSFSQGGMPMLGFDLVLQASSEDNGESLSGKSGLWADNVTGPMVPIPMDSAYLGLAFEGLDKAALIRIHQLNRELDSLQTSMVIDGLSGEGQSDMAGQLEKLQTLISQMMQVASEQLLKPGNSNLSLQLLVDNEGKRQLTFDSKTRYLGVDGKNLPFETLSLLDEEQMKQMLDLYLRVDVDQSLVPPPFVGKLQELESAGLVQRSDSSWRGSFRSDGNTLQLNGETVTVDEVKRRMELLAPQEPELEQPEPLALMSIE